MAAADMPRLAAFLLKANEDRTSNLLVSNTRARAHNSNSDAAVD